MRLCRQIGRRIHGLASSRLTQMPAEIAPHLTVCPTCRRTVAAIRMTRGLVAALAEAPEPPVDFPDRIMGALAMRRNPVPLLPLPWQDGWGLVPIMAILALGLFVLYQTQVDQDVHELLSADNLSVSEQLALGTVAPQPEQVLAAVLEDDAP